MSQIQHTTLHNMRPTNLSTITLLGLIDILWHKQKDIKVKVKEVDLYSAFIVVPHTQGAHVRITQFNQQITPYLPLPRKHSPDAASPD